MKRRLLLGWISIIGFFFLVTIVDVYANPVYLPNPTIDPYGIVILIFIMFIMAVGIEYLVFTQKSYELAPRDKRLLFTFLKINLITFPLTQILAFVVMLYAFLYYWIYILVIEILVIIAEWRLITLEFDKKYDRLLASRPALKLLIKANIISFFLGFLPYLLTIFISI